MAGETTVTSLNDLIHSQQIEELILAANRPASVHQLIAWARDASKGGAGTYQFPKLGQGRHAGRHQDRGHRRLHHHRADDL
jgi:hypothetical protein